MPHKTQRVTLGLTERTVRTSAGTVLEVPTDWQLLPPGDGTLTRRVKAAGPTWTVEQKRGRRIHSLGVWAPAETIQAIRGQLAVERSTDTYRRQRAASVARRHRHQQQYIDEFRKAVVAFLDFAAVHAQLEQQLADAVTCHATPVGSGTVARTQRIPIEQRVESAVIAWLRHQTTEYEGLKIARVKGRRRQVRRQLAERSRQLLDGYRRGDDPGPNCPLRTALSHWHLDDVSERTTDADLG